MGKKSRKCKSVLVAAVAVFTLAGCGKSGSSGTLNGANGSLPAWAMAPLPPGFKECPADFPSSVVNDTNQLRAQNSVPWLAGNSNLMGAARVRAITMAKNNNLSHDGWDSTVRQSGYNGNSIAENIANYYSTPQDVVNAWAGDSAHYDNLVSRSYSDVGVGCVIDAQGLMWWAQDFGGD